MKMLTGRFAWYEPLLMMFDGCVDGLMKLLIVGCWVAEMSMLCVDEEERTGRWERGLFVGAMALASDL
jgi:hypothetical protein